jgi:hypothetical protein
MFKSQKIYKSNTNYYIINLNELTIIIEFRIFIYEFNYLIQLKLKYRLYKFLIFLNLINVVDKYKVIQKSIIKLCSLSIMTSSSIFYKYVCLTKIISQSVHSLK